MLILKVLNAQATVNDFEEYTSFDFIPSTDIVLTLRVHDTVTGLRRILNSDDTLSLALTKSDNTTLTLVPTFPFTADRSIIQVTITDVQSADLLGGSITLTITDNAGLISKAVGANLLNRIIEGDC